MKSFSLFNRTLLVILVLFLTQQITYAQSQTYEKGEKVEVRHEGKWMEGTYQNNLERFSNMKATPHQVSIETNFMSGTIRVTPADIRKYTGTIAPLVKKPEGPPVESINVKQLNNEIVDEINFMRTQPKEYAKKLSKLKSKYLKVDDKYWYIDMLGLDGIYIADNDAERYAHERSLDEAITDLKNAKPMTKLTKNEKLRVCAEMKATDRGGYRHTDSKGRSPQDRAKIAGYNGHVEENLTGGLTAFGIVSSYLIDHGVESRGHRKSLMRSMAREIGVANYYVPGKEISFGNAVVLAYGEKGQGAKTEQSSTTTEPKLKTRTSTSSVAKAFSLEYVSGGNQSYSGGGMPSAMVFKINEKSAGQYVTNLRDKGLSFEVTANISGQYDGAFSNYNDYCKNGDKSCFGGYYYVPSNRGKSPYTLEVTVTLKKGNEVMDTYVVKQNIK